MFKFGMQDSRMPKAVLNCLTSRSPDFIAMEEKWFRFEACGSGLGRILVLDLDRVLN